MVEIAPGATLTDPSTLPTWGTPFASTDVIWIMRSPAGWQASIHRLTWSSSPVKTAVMVCESTCVNVPQQLPRFVARYLPVPDEADSFDPAPRLQPEPNWGQ